MITAERVFEWLLRAYPREFRSSYGREMTMIFRDQRRDGRDGVRFWMECGWDVVRSAPPLRMQSWGSRWRMDTQSTLGVMVRITMAILSILIGVFETTNALVEGRAAAGVGGLDGAALLSLSLVIVAGLLLLAAGLSQAIRSAKAAALSLGAAVTCLAAFVLIGVVSPRMSIFSMMLGIGFPIVLLLFLRFGRGQSTGVVA